MAVDVLSVEIDLVAPSPDGRPVLVARGRVLGAATSHPSLVVNAQVAASIVPCTVDEPTSDGVRPWRVEHPVVGPSAGLPRLAIVAHADHQVAVATHDVLPDELPGAGIHGSLDMPADGHTVVDDVVHLAGWCLFDGAATARVDVVVDGETIARARPYLDRWDLVADWRHRDAPVGGFQSRVPVRHLPIGQPTEVLVDAYATDGRRWRSAPITITRRPTATSVDDLEYADILAERGNSTARQRDTGRPRVAVVTHDLGYGGGQLWLSEMLRHFQMVEGFDFEVFSLSDGPLRNDLEAAGIPVTVTEGPAVHSLRRHQDRVNAWAVTLAACGADAVLVNTVICFQAVMGAHRAGLPSMWAIHESFDPDVYAHTVWGGTMETTVRRDFAQSLGLPAALVFEARETAAIFREWSTAPQRRILDYGVDVDEIDRFRAGFDRRAARAAMGWTDDDVVLSVVGVFEGRKAHAAMVAVFEELAAVHPSAHLLLVGRHGSAYCKAVDEQIARSVHGHRIHVVGVTPDIAQWYAVSDLLVCASDVESLPRSILEAMAHRLPVVSTAVFGVASLLDDGLTGWLAPIGDTRAMAATLHRVLRAGPDEWARVAERARLDVERRSGDRPYGTVLADALVGLAQGKPDALAELDEHEPADPGGHHVGGHHG